MGVICVQAVVCITYDWKSNDRTELDKLVEAHPKLFTKSETMVNGVINYVMFWDGSKEGWDDSDEGDELRKKFISLVKKLLGADLYEIYHYEDGNPQLKHTLISNFHMRGE